MEKGKLLPKKYDLTQFQNSLHNIFLKKDIFIKNGKLIN